MLTRAGCPSLGRRCGWAMAAWSTLHNGVRCFVTHSLQWPVPRHRRNVKGQINIPPSWCWRRGGMDTASLEHLMTSHVSRVPPPCITCRYAEPDSSWEGLVNFITVVALYLAIDKCEIICDADTMFCFIFKCVLCTFPISWPKAVSSVVRVAFFPLNVNLSSHMKSG